MTPSNSKGNGGLFGYYECKYRPCIKKSRIRKEAALSQIKSLMESISIPNEIVIAFISYLRKDIEKSLNRSKITNAKVDSDIKNIEQKLLDLSKDYFIDKRDGLDSEVYASLKNDLTSQKNTLIGKKTELQIVDKSVLEKAQKAGFVLKNMSEIDENKNKNEFRDLVRALYSNNVVCSNGNVRTDNINEFASLMLRIAREKPINDKGSKVLLSTLAHSAPSPGLEPGTP